jgi:hypothetical protein
MATSLTCGKTTGISLSKLERIQVFSVSWKVVFVNIDGTRITITGPDAKDFIANVLPILGGKLIVNIFDL